MCLIGRLSFLVVRGNRRACHNGQRRGAAGALTNGTASRTRLDQTKAPRIAAACGTMFAAYFDESGTDQHAPVCVVAGLISPCLQWEKLEQEWQRVLTREGIETFHMKDFAHSTGEFECWKHDRRRRDRLMTSLINIVKRRVQWRVWTAIVKEDYRNLFQGSEREDYLYSLCAIGCASQVRWLSVKAYKDRYVNFVFESGGPGSHHAFDAFQNLLDNDRRDFYRMQSLTLAKKTPVLQAADVHAYEVCKYFSDQVNETGRAMRKSFQGLLEVGDGGGYLMTLEKLSQWVAHMKRRRAADDPGETPIPISIDRLDRRHCINLRRVTIENSVPRSLETGST